MKDDCHGMLSEVEVWVGQPKKWAKKSNSMAVTI